MCAADGTTDFGPRRGAVRVTSASSRLLDRTLNAPDLVGSAYRIALLAVLALAAAAVHVSRPATFCPLRAMTGIPCPFCGSTTAAVALGHGNVVAALSANPVTVLVGTAWVMGPVGTTLWWWGLPGSRRSGLVATLLAVAWVWQLVRWNVL